MHGAPLETGLLSHVIVRCMVYCRRTLEDHVKFFQSSAGSNPLLPLTTAVWMDPSCCNRAAFDCVRNIYSLFRF